MNETTTTKPLFSIASIDVVHKVDTGQIQGLIIFAFIALIAYQVFKLIFIAMLKAVGA